jgi:hypothetical protein
MNPARQETLKAAITKRWRKELENRPMEIVFRITRRRYRGVC